MLKTYISLVGLQFAGFAISACFLILVSVAVPAEVFGQYSLLLSIVQVVATIGLAWTNAALLRFAREEYTMHGRIGEVLGTRLLIHGVLLVLILPGLWWFFPQIAAWIGVDRDALPLLMACLIVFSLGEIGNYAAQAIERFAAYGIVPLVIRAFQLGAVLLILLGLPPSWQLLMTGALVGYAVAGLISWHQIPAKLLGDIRISRQALGRMMAYSWSIPLGSMGGVLVAWMDLWFIRYYLDLDAVGAYSLAYYIVAIASAILIPLSAVLSPRLIDFKVDGKKDAIAGYLRQCSALFLLLVSFMPIVMAAAIAVFSVFELGDYAAALGPVLVLLAATSFMGMNYLLNPMLSAHEHLVARGVAMNLGVAAVNALGNWWLIPLLGVLGAALATAAAFAFSMVASFILTRMVSDEMSIGFMLCLLVFGIAGVGLAVWVVNLGSVPAVLACGLGTVTFIFLARKTAMFEGLVELADWLAASAFSRHRLKLAGILRWLANPTR